MIRRLVLSFLLSFLAAPAESAEDYCWFNSMISRRASGSAADDPATLPVFGDKPYTIALWVKAAAPGPLLAHCPPHGKWPREGQVLTLKGTLFFEGNGTRIRGRNRTVSDGQWHHVAFVCGLPSDDGPSTCMFVDGKPGGSKAVVPRTDPDSYVFKLGYVAFDYPWFERPAEYFEGFVDDLRFFDRALTAEQISQLAAGEEPYVAATDRWAFDGDCRNASGEACAMATRNVRFVEGRLGRAIELKGGAHVAVFARESFDRTVWQLSESARDPAIRRQVSWALEDGVLRPDFRTISLEEQARRYCTAIRFPTSLQKEALTIASRPVDVAALKRIHAIYLRARAYANDYAHLTAAEDLAERTLAMVERLEPRPEMRKQLAALAARVAAAGERRCDDIWSLREEILAQRRRIVFSHPALGFDQLLINKRSHQLRGHMVDQYLGRHSTPGTGLTIIENWKTDPRARPILAGKLPKGTTTHPDISYDGHRVLFAFCSHDEQAENELEKTLQQEAAAKAATSKSKRLPKGPTTAMHRRFWIYEAAVDGGWVRQLTGTADDPLTTWGNRRTVLIEDWDPSYLPDSGFAFVSTRAQCYGRCHGARYAPSYLLYRADGDGRNIRQLSFGEANEWDPAVLNDGRIVFTRWDYIDRNNTVFQSLWTTRPDGTATAHFYGNYTTGPAMLAESAPMPEGPMILSTATDHHGPTRGSILRIDPRRGRDGPEPLLKMTPEIGFVEGRPPEGTPDTPMPLRGWAADRGRKTATPFPLTEDLYLVAMQLESKGNYAIVLADALGGRELIYADSDESCFSPIPVQPRVRPPSLPSTLAEDATEKTGTFFVQDVHFSTQPIEPGTIKALRINRIVGQPTRGSRPRSITGDEIAKQILGTVPVRKDGSVYFRAPAETPLQFQALDENGMAVMTMRSFVYLQRGEQQSCVGCHESRVGTTPALSRRPTGEPSPIAPPVGPRYDGAVRFVARVQPVLDRYCIDCHGAEDPAAGLSLVGTPAGTPTEKFNTAHDQLHAREGLIRPITHTSQTHHSTLKDFFAHASRLAPMLLAGHPDDDGKQRVNLDRESWMCIVEWLDLNAGFYGDYSHNRIDAREVSPEGEKALREHVAKTFGEKLAAAPLETLVNRAVTDESRILRGPLATEAGGWGTVPGGWPSTDAPSYRTMRALVEKVFLPREYEDIQGTCGRDADCRCGNCWIRAARDRYLQEK